MFKYLIFFFSLKKQKKQQKPGYIKPAYQKQQAVQKREKRDPNKTGSQKTVKQLLGELYADKVYLEKLLEDDSKRYSNSINNNNNNQSNKNNEIYNQNNNFYNNLNSNNNNNYKSSSIILKTRLSDFY